MPLFTSDSNVTISLPPVAFDPSLWSTAAKQLNLKYLAEHPDVAAQLLQSGLSADAAALHILRLECEYRARHKTVMLMAMAKFPDGALTLENFDFSVSSLDESQFRSLAGLTWMQNHVNLLFWGDSGLGKTHLLYAIAGKIHEQNRNGADQDSEHGYQSGDSGGTPASAWTVRRDHVIVTFASHLLYPYLFPIILHNGSIFQKQDPIRLSRHSDRAVPDLHCKNSIYSRHGEGRTQKL